jgi:hypothetical protein
MSLQQELLREGLREGLRQHCQLTLRHTVMSGSKGIAVAAALAAA